MTSPVLGPCTTWITANDVKRYCADQTKDYTAVAAMASMVLFEASGRQYPGVCTSTVRPCITSSCSLWAGVPPSWIANSAVGWGWYGSYGGWGWGGGRDGVPPCGCGSLNAVRLSGYPVTAITSVLVGGVSIDLAQFRVDRYREIVWLDDTTNPANPVSRPWPSCQNLGVPDTQPGTYSITYTHGVAPPPVGAEAAAQLACFFMSEQGQAACRLPDGASKVTRAGVTIDRGIVPGLSYLVARWGGGMWNTGLGMVDSFLNTYNPRGVRRRASSWTPSSRHRYPRRMTG